MAVCLQASIKSRKVVVISSCLYNYVQVETSVTHSKAREISYDALESTNFIKRTIGNEIDQIMLDCLYLLIISSGLRAGITAKDNVFRHTIKEHGNFRSISKLPLLKALNVGLYRYLNINLARFL